jgi:hypothetical protein
MMWISLKNCAADSHYSSDNGVPVPQENWSENDAHGAGEAQTLPVFIRSPRPAAFNVKQLHLRFTKQSFRKFFIVITLRKHFVVITALRKHFCFDDHEQKFFFFYFIQLLRISLIMYQTS